METLTLLKLKQEKEELAGDYAGAAAGIFGEGPLANCTDIVDQLVEDVLTFTCTAGISLIVHCLFLSLEIPLGCVMSAARGVFKNPSRMCVDQFG
jgi:hypothetical protein